MKCAVLIATSLSLLGAAPTGPVRVPVFTAQVESVTVDVETRDDTGAPIRGLTADDFTVSEDGQPQALTSFEVVEAEPLPPRSSGASPVVTNMVSPAPRRTIVLVYDDAHLNVAQAENARKAVAVFFERLADGDCVQLVTTSNGATWSAVMPEGKADLVARLERSPGLRRRPTGRDNMADAEAYAITILRDERVQRQVWHRFQENGVIADHAVQSGRNTPPGRVWTRAEIDELVEGMSYVNERASQVHREARVRRTATLDALTRAVESLREIRGRKSVLLVSAGFYHETNDPGFMRVQEAARRANVAIDFVDARQPGQGDTVANETDAEVRPRLAEERFLNFQRDYASLDAVGAATVAADTGGQHLGTFGSLAETLTELAGGPIFYRLGYTHDTPRQDGRFHSIKVVVRRPGVTVRARRGYFAVKPGQASPREGELDPGVRQALESPAGGGALPLRQSVYVLGPGAEGRSKVLLVTEVDPAALSLAADGSATLETFAMTTARDDGHREIRQTQVELHLSSEQRAGLAQSWLPLQRLLELPPGAHQVRMVVREAGSGRVGSVVQAVTVDEPGRFRLTTPVLTDQMIPSEEGSRPAPVARRVFATGTRLLVQIEALGAAGEEAGGPPKVSLGLEVARGEAVVARQEPSLLPVGPDGRLTRTLAVRLTTPGWHVVRLTARDEITGRVVERRESFFVEGQEVATAEVAAAGLSDLPPDPVHQPRLLAAYRSGQAEAAVAALARWPLEARLRALGATRAGPDDRAVLAAVLVHTEAAFVGGGLGAVLEVGDALLNSVPDTSKRGSWLAAWRVAVGRRLQAATDIDAAERLYERCLDEAPADPEAHLAIGSVHELRVALGLPPLRLSGRREPPPAGSTTLRELQRRSERDRDAAAAEQHYRAAASAPELAAEARLRLGRVRQLRGDLLSARTAYESFGSGRDDPRLEALAKLFLGGLAESQKGGDAATHYRAAMAAVPSQSAAVALTAALIERGDRGEIVDVLRRGLAVEGDLWGTYNFGLVTVRDGLVWLRAESREVQ